MTPELVADAFEHGVGATFNACFNRAETNTFSEPWEHEATVRHLDDVTVTPARGMLEGRRIRLGRCALLAVGGIEVAVSSIRQQITSDDYLAAIGADTESARVFIVKSRGHFRAGFDHLVDDANIIEVDCPALATPNLHALPWNKVMRPIYPLDPEMEWSPSG
ncbi:MAG: MlrC C-terminal domain-containing protein [Gammaproteobacteria bacterium]|nr:MlrC C-terminal domain-containing protein [Gammaproteobacteria bacterium]